MQFSFRKSRLSGCCDPCPKVACHFGMVPGYALFFLCLYIQIEVPVGNAQYCSGLLLFLVTEEAEKSSA